MPITIKHGAELEGKGLAYGAAAKASYIRQQEDEQKEEQKKAKRLGNIGSVLSTAGAITAFIPGLQPVGAGLSIAGGALGSLSGGAGDPGGQAIAMSAQGISQVYQAQASKVEARQQELEDWTRRADYTQELGSLSKSQDLARQVKVRDDEFTRLIRGQNQKYQDQKNAVLSAVGLDAFKSYDLNTLEEASMNTGQYGNALKQVIPKLKELQQENWATLWQIREARQNDPTITVERHLKQQKEEADNQQEQLEQEQKQLENQAELELKQAKDRRSELNTNLNIVADTSKELDKLTTLQAEEPEAVSAETIDDLTQQNNKAKSNVNILRARNVEANTINLANGDPVIWEQAGSTWIKRRTEESLERLRVLAGDSITDEQWASRIGGLTIEYEGRARDELNRIWAKSPASTMRELAELLDESQYGFMPIQVDLPVSTSAPIEPKEKKETLGERLNRQIKRAVTDPKKDDTYDFFKYGPIRK